MKIKLNSNRNIRGDAEIAVFLVICLILVVLFFGGMVAGDTAMRKSAVAVGCAHYEVDTKTGKTTFMWDVPTGTNSVAVPYK